MRVLAHVKRAVRIVRPAVIADGLRDGQDMGLGKSSVQGRSAMSTGAEANQLVGIGHIGLTFIIIPLELREIHQH
jgi:hypothetical protein